LKDLILLSLSILSLAISILILSWSVWRLGLVVLHLYHHYRVTRVTTDEEIKRVRLEGEIERREYIRRVHIRQARKAWEIQGKIPVPDRQVEPIETRRKARKL